MGSSRHVKCNNRHLLPFLEIRLLQYYFLIRNSFNIILCRNRHFFVIEICPIRYINFLKETKPCSLFRVFFLQQNAFRSCWCVPSLESFPVNLFQFHGYYSSSSSFWSSDYFFSLSEYTVIAFSVYMIIEYRYSVLFIDSIVFTFN